MRILIAVDIDDISTEVAATAARWADRGDEVHLISVIDPAAARPTYTSSGGRHVPTRGERIHGRLAPMPAEAPRVPAESAAQAAERAHREREGLIARKLAGIAGADRWQVHVEIDADPADCILRAADRIAADTIIMGTHGRTGITATVLGSVAQSVIHRASVPVLVIRKDATGARPPDRIPAGATEA